MLCGVQKFLLFYGALIQVLTFLVWGLDKWKARRDKRRISERTLLLLTLAGGGLGAWAGVRLFRHKSKKRSFQWKLVLVTPGILVLFWAWWRLGQGG